jgi:hypothetical protein
MGNRGGRADISSASFIRALFPFQNPFEFFEHLGEKRGFSVRSGGVDSPLSEVRPSPPAPPETGEDLLEESAAVNA